MRFPVAHVNSNSFFWPERQDAFVQGGSEVGAISDYLMCSFGQYDSNKHQAKGPRDSKEAKSPAPASHLCKDTSKDRS